MTVGSSTQNQLGDRGLVKAKSVPYFLLGEGVFQQNDLVDDLLGCATDEAKGNRVFGIAELGYPFEVRPHVVGFDAVNVIDLRKIIGVLDEGHSHEAMNAYQFSSGVIHKPHSGVSILIEVGLQNPSLECLLSSVSSHDDSAEAADDTGVADFVKIHELGDGDTPPFFDEHNMGPCARSAHVIASFSAHQGD
jgi:hypothetical protein